MQAQSRVGGWVAGCCLGGMAVGAVEAALQRVPLPYAMGLYGLGWALVGAGAGAIAAVRPRRLHLRRPTAGATGVALAFSWGISGAALVRFWLWRDLLHEAPGRGWLATCAGLAAGAALAALAGALARSLHLARLDGRSAALMAGIALALLVSGWRGPEASPPPALPTAADAPAAGQARPGAIMVVVDALRADALGLYGAGLHRGRRASPELDALAAESLVFERTMAQASWTKPAVASLLTSRGVAGHGTMAKAAALPPALPSLARSLQARGVLTGAVVTNPNLNDFFGFAHGFDAFRYLAPDRYWGAPVGASRLTAYSLLRLGRERLWRRGRLSRHFYQPAAAVNAHAWALLDAPPGRPFFLWLHYMEPHDPYFAVDGTSWARVSDPEPPPTAAPLLRDAYRDEVHRVDAALGELVAGLKARGLWDSTLLCITADHGEEFGEHGGFYHGTSLYEEMVRVPLILHGPGVNPGRSAHLARQIDVAPTLLAHFGAPQPPSWEGRNLLSPPPLTEAVGIAEEDHQGHRIRAVRGVGRDGRHDAKLILANPNNPRRLPATALFDLALDPQERHPLDPTDPRAEPLRAHLQAAQAGSPPPSAAEAPLDAASEAELRSLGYVQ